MVLKEHQKLTPPKGKCTWCSRNKLTPRKVKEHSAQGTIRNSLLRKVREHGAQGTIRDLLLRKVKEHDAQGTFRNSLLLKIK